MPNWEGVLNIDKPEDMTSHDVVNRIRRAAGIRRVGHAGTLDPLATGVLLVCLGRATRLVEYLVGQPKEYEATVRLGQVTDTYDADGEVIAEHTLIDITEERISEALSPFKGVIQQQPPMYSAIKKDGQPLYKLARKGIEVERASRQVTIFELELLGWRRPDLKLRVACSTGTYVRALAHDLGQLLGCGGHIRTLRRTAIGEFTAEQALPLDQLEAETLESHLLPAETAVAHLPRLDLTMADSEALGLGQAAAWLPGQPLAPLVRAYDPNGRFIGIICRSEQIWRPRKIFHAETD